MKIGRPMEFQLKMNEGSEFSEGHHLFMVDWKLGGCSPRAACSALQVRPGYGDGTGYWNKRQGVGDSTVTADSG